MRPRSRLLAKKRLPTIREGQEELLQDMNQVNSCHAPHHGLSSDDYLLSIRQLATPAFPLRQQDHDILSLGQLEALRPRLRISRLPAPSRPLTPAARGCGYWQEKEEEKRRAESVSRETAAAGRGHGGDGCRVAPDPLEYLYGCRDNSSSFASIAQDTKGRLSEDGVPEKGGARSGPRPLPRSQSFPRHCSPHHTHRKGSCPEIRLADMPGPAPSGTQPMGGSPGKKPSITTLSREADQEVTGRGSPAGQRKNCSAPADKHSMISSWITDCRNTWHEARIRACMLPTIAEI